METPLNALVVNSRPYAVKTEYEVFPIPLPRVNKICLIFITHNS